MGGPTKHVIGAIAKAAASFFEAHGESCTMVQGKNSVSLG
jgi:hypothetical protein